MTRDLARYRELESRLLMVRFRHEGMESEEEDAVLDEMEGTWTELTPDEQAVLRLEGPTCWPVASAFLTPCHSDTLSTAAPASWDYEGFHSVAEAILSAEAA